MCKRPTELPSLKFEGCTEEHMSSIDADEGCSRAFQRLTKKTARLAVIARTAAQERFMDCGNGCNAQNASTAPHLGFDSGLNPVCNLASDALQQRKHDRVVPVVPGDDPHHAKGTHQRWQAVAHRIECARLQDLEMSLQRGQELEVAPGLLCQLQQQIGASADAA